MSRFEEFSELELVGWRERAGAYNTTTHRMTGQTIPELVAATGLQPRQRVLDVCCGTGAVSRYLCDLGARVTGIDFAPEMVRQATAQVADAIFMVGDAENLPAEIGQFDVVLTNFGHYHLPHPERAVHEAARVLKAGGRYGFTTWVGPNDSPGFAMIFETILGNVDPAVHLPDAPDAFLLADPDSAKTLLTEAGFSEISVTTFPSEIVCAPDEFVGFLKAATVRATLVLKAQAKNVQIKIQRLLRERIEDFVVDGLVHLPVPNRIITATRT